MADYFAYVTESAEIIMRHRDNLQIFTYNKKVSDWKSAIFEYHTTFETLAIEPDLKKTLISDIDAFSKAKDFFKSVGRAWKCGYLFWRPPGTGKSVMVAAISNHMKYNIYDLQIQSIRDGGELHEILTCITNRSILLLKDMPNKRKKMMSPKRERTSMKSGFLNFLDGLWSSCGEKKIIIFTTKHKEMLDLAFLRPGRMDVHILMDYFTMLVFNKLVSLYLKIDGHSLCDFIEKLKS
ncbi:hypothetical protein N665_0027s0066 [Sinapis alba]|nr:hypothetical protein N665_0027s0066 [Sinapis alba]